MRSVHECHVWGSQPLRLGSDRRAQQTPYSKDHARHGLHRETRVGQPRRNPTLASLNPPVCWLPVALFTAPGQPIGEFKMNNAGRARAVQANAPSAVDPEPTMSIHCSVRVLQLLRVLRLNCSYCATAPGECVQGTRAITLAGHPEPPTSFGTPTITQAPAAGRDFKLVRFSRCHTPTEWETVL